MLMVTISVKTVGHSGTMARASYQVMYCNIEKENGFTVLITGVVLSVISGALFTANNFVINQFDVAVSDAVLVRCVIQIIIFTFIIFFSGDKILPENKKTILYTVGQG